MNNHTTKYISFILVAFVLTAGVCSPAFSKDAPNLSSSLAKNLWRQCQYYFEDGMDAKAIRACGEMRDWAQKNGESAIEQEMNQMLKTLQGRQQAPAAPQPQAKKVEPAMRTDLPACGYDSVNAIPMNVVVKIVSRTPQEFLTCQKNEDCVVARNFCGTTKAVNNASKECYEEVAQFFEKNAGCTPVDPFQASAVCRNQTCMLQF